MAEEFTWNDRYAGDAAWTEWFEICSVAGCRPEYAAALRAEIESAMYAHLAKCGLTREDAGNEDPVAFFDSYFKLKGSRDTRKPLKSYFRYRIETEKIPLVSFVCGTLFGSASGRVRAIVIEWVTALKGWKARTVQDQEGKRKLQWENAPAQEDGAELADLADPAAFLDETPIRREVEGALTRLADKLKVEKRQVALLLYVTAQDISITEPVILKALGTGKSRAYVVRDKVMQAFKRELEAMEGADDPLFGRILLETCEAGLGAALRRELEGGAA